MAAVKAKSEVKEYRVTVKSNPGYSEQAPAAPNSRTVKRVSQIEIWLVGLQVMKGMRLKN